MNNFDPYDKTQDGPENPIPPFDTGIAEHPQRIGRYRIEHVLGKGGFGIVYLAHDEQLNRRVAVKVPHAKLISKPEDAEAYLAEARTVANLDHPGIVPVHDVGSMENCPCYIVSKYIPGTDLASKIKQRRLKYREAAEIVATVAESLHYAHKQGLVHRDVKPGNILIGKDDKPYVVDFGLALREENIGKGPKYAGTPAYMSPEQARGEGHRVDGRSDVFSLGIVFYELLAGRQPFRGDTQAELLEQVTSYEARPLRQFDEKLPKELERICHKAMAKRANDRYSSAHDLAEDLRHFLAEQTVIQSGASPGGIVSVASDTHASHIASTSVGSIAASAASLGTVSSDSQPIKIVPKGLRSFDAHDADFFLELLPGPRDREGLPDSLRFWKTRIEETDPDNTYKVGLIYGPSGCGKSSLVKAGLLPRLSDEVIAVYIEATPEETETRLLHCLRKRCPALEDDLTLKETLAELRRGQGIPVGKKVLIVLDQFEQWLHAKKEEENTELVQALRQCDGSRVQCIVMVRDDFWLAVSRFLRDLEVRLLEGENSALADLFDLEHARKVLAAFGRAFGKLPENVSETSSEQKDFVKQSVAGLAEEGKVICVRLALFAEMMKGKSWTAATLREVGGTKGVGVTFLEETFSASTSPPEHRYHQKAARAVLRTLLPNSGTDIKGEMKTRDELLAVSGYANRPKDFDELLRILDSEIRLITPTDPEGKDTGNDSWTQTQEGQKYYQLTHDYLVPSLRDWLTRKQRETKQGRAELKLEERASAWNAKREPKQLPTLPEWFGIGRLTDRKHWTDIQRSMMRSANRMHVTRVGLAAVLIVAITGIGLATKSYIDRQRETLISKNRIEKLEAEASSRVDGLLKVDSLSLILAVDALKEYREWAQDDLENAFTSSAEDSNAKLHAGLALLSSKASPEPALAHYLKERLLTVSPTQLAPVRTLLEPHKAELIPAYWQIALDDKQSAIRRFHAASALAAFDPSNTAWGESKFAAFVSEQLVAVSPTYISQYQELVRPVSAKLIPALTLIFKDPARGELARTLATSLLADYTAQDPATLVDLVIAADAPSDKALFPVLQKHRDVAVKRFESILDRSVKPNWHDGPLDTNWVEPDATIQASMESAHGMIGERFAYVVDMPMDKFIEVAEKLRTSGYRPTRVRAWSPEPLASSAQVAAIWTRDTKRWNLETSIAKTALPSLDKNAEKDGLLLDDICVMPTTEESSDPTCIILWSEPTREKEQRRVVVDATEQEIIATSGQLTEKGIQSQRTISVRTNSRGERLYTGIWSNEGAPSELRPAYAGFELVHQPQWDVAVAPAGRLPDPLDTFRKQLASFEKLPAEKFDDPKLRELRATANYSIGNIDAALTDFDMLTENDKNSATVLQYRTLTLARLGEANEAQASLEKYLATDSPASFKTYLQIQLPAWLGDYDKAWEQLQTAATASALSENDMYNVACAGALCSQAFQPKNSEQAKKFADRTIELWEKLIQRGYRNATRLKADADFASLHTDPRFALLIEQIEPAPRFAALWQADIHFESKLITVDTTKESRQSIQQLIAQGYRPQAIAVDSNFQLPTSPFQLLLHLPVIPDDEKESLAIEQSAAATALLRFGAVDRVWPLLQDQPDSRRRSYLLHRLTSYEVDPQSLFNQLTTEAEVSCQRTLILGLGEFARAKLLSSEQHASLLRDLIRRYSIDPDSGIHGAAEWSLRQLEAEDEITKVKAAYSTGAPVGDRNWYLTKTGANNNTSLTLTIIHPPNVFIMSSPVHEVDRFQGPTSKIEIRHRRRIGRTFAIGEHEVTVAQFKEFRPRHSFDKTKARTSDSPANMISWYDAAEYCNWLSEQEGIPRDQWCYDPAQKFAEGMVLFPDHLQRAGYRLPSEAEWEYACRVGTTTARFYGKTGTLLSEYAWYLTNSKSERLLPVGSLRPNDSGLFDLQGNVSEWCQDRAMGYGTVSEIVEDKEQADKTSNTNNRILRGGSFFNAAADVRSSNRYVDQPGNQFSRYGFRVARTYR